MDYQQFVTAVYAGELDDRLTEAAEVLRDRSKYVRHARAAAIVAGDRVRIGSTIKPRYFAGLTGSVQQKVGTRIEVVLDVVPPQARRYVHPVTGAVRFPESTVEPE